MHATFNRILIVTAIAWQLPLPVQAEAQTLVLPAGASATAYRTPIIKAKVDAVLQASRQPDTPRLRYAIKAN
ncbi:hypothetical protein [Burkholderia cepacia]|uniref:hypothetical protein n=1 Tax=Burkholderia cepacia TaxID=292 RepID=UPI0015891CF6|nr:hypothetical protein [Burkholderia cepacia]